MSGGDLEKLKNGHGFRKPKVSITYGGNPLCKLCRLSVMPTQRRVWLRKPMGVSHADCARQADPSQIEV